MSDTLRPAPHEASAPAARPRFDAARRAARALLLTSIVLPLLLFLGAGWYDQVTLAHEARTRLAASATALAEQTNQALASVDVSLSRILDRVAGMEWPTIASSPGAAAFLQRLRGEQATIGRIVLIDPSGMAALASPAQTPLPADLRSQPYFAAAIDGATGLMLTPPPKTGAPADAPAFTLSRTRISQGAFDGVVAVDVSHRALAGLMRAAALPRHARAVLFGPAGQTLLVLPGTGVLPAPPPLADLPALGAEPALMRLPGAAGGNEAALIRLPRFGLTVMVASPPFDWLGAWLTHMAILAVFAVLAGAALWLTSWLVLAQARRTEAQLALLLSEIARREEVEHTLLEVQKMEALGRLSGGVAHEFNNLLAAILGSVELAGRRVQEPERVLRLLGGIRQAAERGAILTAQMLTFARSRAVSRQAIDVNQLLGGIEALLRGTAGSLVRVTFDLAGDLARVEADPVQLERALLHLVMNARDAMPLGGELVVQTRPLPPDGASGAAGSVCIAVRDTGEGMSEKVRASAFEPFFTTREPGKGTGLGLSMVHGFAEQLGGSARIESRFGEGTTVRLILPAAAPEAAAAPPPRPVAMNESRSLDVLLVDDEPSVRAMTREMLIELGHRPVDCAGGRAALDLLRAGRGFDVLIVDFALKEPDGAAIATEARAILDDLGILFMTGYVAQDGLGEWAGRGAAAIAKPFQMADLAAALAKIAKPDRSRVVPLRRSR
ncbi:MAG: response regulator [Rhodospirillales bacterium]|nr:response regulator [Rhodospirillales bacterium]